LAEVALRLRIASPLNSSVWLLWIRAPRDCRWNVREIVSWDLTARIIGIGAFEPAGNLVGDHRRWIFSAT
jgi:hypothetical protein